MKIVLYILLGVLVLILGFGAWFFLFFLKIPSIDIPKDASEFQRIEHLDQWFTELQKQNKFNGVVLFAKEGKALLAKGYGYTNHKKDKKLTANSSLRLASVSKQFTAAGIMLLKEKGALDYEDLVSKYIEGFPYKEVSIRNLLNQNSGIPDIYMELAERERDAIPLLTNDRAVDLIIKEQRPAESAPNEAFQYSNTNYIILARITELASGLTFEDYMKSSLFEPLGMKNTRVWNLNSKDSTFENKADDFENFKGYVSPISSSFIDGVAGDGAVFSSANDLLIWDQFWYANSLISEQNLKEAFTEPLLTSGKSADYGFGWVITKEGMWHNGAWMGANTMFIRNTEKKTCMAILDNSSNIFFDKILEELNRIDKNK